MYSAIEHSVNMALYKCCILLLLLYICNRCERSHHWCTVRSPRCLKVWPKHSGCFLHSHRWSGSRPNCIRWGLEGCCLFKTYCFRGFAKLNKSTNPKSKIKLHRAHPTHPPCIQAFFGNSSLTWKEHSNDNHWQLSTMYIQTGYTWYTTPKDQYWYRATSG